MKSKKRLSGAARAVVLLSGGLDSATTLYLAKRQGFLPLCLIFDYAQRHKKEINAAKQIARAADAAFQVIKITLPWKGSSLLDRDKKIPLVSERQSPQGGAPLNQRLLCGGVRVSEQIPSTYVPARNIIFLSFALSCAESIGAQAIFIGAHAQDYSGYPDCRPEFYKAFEKVIAQGTKAGVEGKRIKVYTPLIHKGKAQIIRLGIALGVPFKLTWSCYKGKKTPCGSCDSCYYRAKGFKEAGFSAPALHV